MTDLVGVGSGPRSAHLANLWALTPSLACTCIDSFCRAPRGSWQVFQLGKMTDERCTWPLQVVTTLAVAALFAGMGAGWTVSKALILMAGDKWSATLSSAGGTLPLYRGELAGTLATEAL